MPTTTVLAAGQAFHFQARQGHLIYLHAGTAGICAAPTWLETPYFEAEYILQEGQCYTVGNSGWTSIFSYGGCELTCIAPASRLQRLAARANRLLGRLAVLRQPRRWGRATGA